MPLPYTNGHTNTFDMSQVVTTYRPYVPEVDPLIKSQLDDLNRILGRKIFPHDWLRQTNAVGPINLKTRAASARGTKPAAASASASAANAVHAQLEHLLTAPLTPKRVPANDWAKDSLAQVFSHTPEANGNISLSNLIDATPELATLKYAFQDDIQSSLSAIDANARHVLEGYPAIRDFLVAYAFHVMSLEDDSAIKNFILSNPYGVKNIADYTIVSAARAYINRERLKVPDYNDDDSAIVANIKAADFGLEADSFTGGIKALVANQVFNSRELALIDFARKNGFSDLKPEATPVLVKFIQSSPVNIDEKNILMFMPVWLLQIDRSQQPAAQAPLSPAQSDLDFNVTFLDDDRSQLQISKSAVLCASQLYYSMVLGDELEVFNVVNFFTHKYLIRGALTIDDTLLRQDLQAYVFSNRFTDLRNNSVVDRTRAAERGMFYRQVFNQGGGQVTEDVIVNQEFPRLWKVLMLESANYLERAQISPNPDSYVPRQNVMQAVEDLQYNLSTHCTGMSNVITPMIYAELDFVIRRFFMHPEIVRQVVPSGGNWWRVVEVLYMAMKNERPKTKVVYSKAVIGNEIFKAIAKYDPAVFARNQPFSAFMGQMQRFITTQSILQDAVKHELSGAGADDDSDDADDSAHMPQEAESYGAAGAGSAAAGRNGAAQDWDF